MRATNYFSKILFITVVASLLLSSCKPRMIPNTSVKSTKENRGITEFLAQYKSALEKLNTTAIMELVAKDYNDNMGSEDPALHVNYLTLKEKLDKTIPRLKELRVGIFIQHIKKMKKGVYEVVFYFNRHSLAELPEGEKWFSTKEVSRMTVRKTTDKNSLYSYEITSGL